LKSKLYNGLVRLQAAALKGRNDMGDTIKPVEVATLFQIGLIASRFIRALGLGDVERLTELLATDANTADIGLELKAMWNIYRDESLRWRGMRMP
jgi:hypothetical protein